LFAENAFTTIGHKGATISRRWVRGTSGSRHAGAANLNITECPPNDVAATFFAVARVVQESILEVVINGDVDAGVCSEGNGPKRLVADLVKGLGISMNICKRAIID
jgi:hypothetical protein